MIRANEPALVRAAMASVKSVRRTDSMYSKLYYGIDSVLPGGLCLEWSGGYAGSLYPEECEFHLWDGEEDVPADVRAEASTRLCQQIMAVIMTENRTHGRKERNSWEFQASL